MFRKKCWQKKLLALFFLYTKGKGAYLWREVYALA